VKLFFGDANTIDQKMTKCQGLGRFHLRIRKQPQNLPRSVSKARTTRRKTIKSFYIESFTALQDSNLLIPKDLVFLSSVSFRIVDEHMVFDGQPHASVSSHPLLAARAFVVSSFGKTYHVTGWKIGYVAAPAALMLEFRKVHQYNVFSVNAPMQHGVAAYMADPAPWRDLPAFYQKKRDLFRAGLAGSRFEPLPADGTYFQCVRYGAISDLPEAEFAKWLTREVKVAAIPVSAFYSQPRESGIVRFCFAKRDETLELALERLAVL